MAAEGVDRRFFGVGSEDAGETGHVAGFSGLRQEARAVLTTWRHHIDKVFLRQGQNGRNSFAHTVAFAPFPNTIWMHMFGDLRPMLF